MKRLNLLTQFMMGILATKLLGYETILTQLLAKSTIRIHTKIKPSLSLDSEEKMASQNRHDCCSSEAVTFKFDIALLKICFWFCKKREYFASVLLSAAVHVIKIYSL